MVAGGIQDGVFLATDDWESQHVGTVNGNGARITKKKLTVYVYLECRRPKDRDDSRLLARAISCLSLQQGRGE